MGAPCYSFLAFSLLVFLGPSVGFRGRDTVCSNVCPLLTTSNGAPVDDKTTSMTAGPLGPVVLQDFVLLDELSHFNRERIPERVMHAKGAGAFGYFEVTDLSITKYCSASLFQEIGKRTEVAARFSTVTRESGSCDTIRETRGASIKFYTDDGNWDLVGLNSPIFFVRDPILFPSLAHAQKRNPATHLPDNNMLWDFISNEPQTLHGILFIFSDLGIPDGYRYMNLHGVHTFKMVNKKRMPSYVKFHFTPDQGVRNLSSEVGQDLCGSDPDYSTRDLFYAIANKQYPSWTMYYQVMTYEQVPKYPWNPFDATKVWPRADYPYHEIGKLVLDRNPINWFNDVEQAAYSPSHLVPGIEPSPDKLLQGRLFAYPDAQRYRLGVNFQQLPVNCPFVTIANNQRDGTMNLNNQGASPNYYPNSVRGSPEVCPRAANSRWRLTGDVARYNAENEDNYSQTREFWRRLDFPAQERLVENISTSLKVVNKDVQMRSIRQFRFVAEDLASRIASKIKELKAQDVTPNYNPFSNLKPLFY